MCLVALFFRMVEDAPVVVGANREEFYARGGEPPQLLPASCRIVGGRDPKAGGTWLGVNEHGLLIAVTNRFKTKIPAQPRSRGLLTRELLESGSAAQAVDRAVRALDGGPYAGCNFLIADQERVVAIHAGEWLHVNPLPPGIHVLTSTRDVDDAADPRIEYSLDWLKSRPYRQAADCLAALGQLCSSTGIPPICLRGEDRGTVSSSLIALRNPDSPSVFLHAQGPPNCAEYDDYSHLLRKFP
jgi:uncharacterized protein with NRDE domain